LLKVSTGLMELRIEDVIERCNRTFVHIGEDFVLIKDSPIQCPFLRIGSWQEAWVALYLRKLQFGQFTEERQIRDAHKYVPFGATEIITEALKAGILDACVLVCDGAGTVITTDPEIVQGIGGRMSGLVYTTPRQNVIHRLQEEGAIVVDPVKARIDPVQGAKRAAELYKKVAVTTTAGPLIEELAMLPEITTFVVHTTGITPEQASYAEKSDIVWGCASKYVRKMVGRHALLQLGVGIPVFVLSEKGLSMIQPQIAALSPETGALLHQNESAISSGSPHVIYHRRTSQGTSLVMEEAVLPVIRHAGPHPLL
jgi:putative methanogenesis marker protein 8